jgi:hypothetical protein
MKAAQFLVTIEEKGVSAIIRKTQKSKGGKIHTYYIVEYFHLGKRKQMWRSGLDEAEADAREACIKVANGEQKALEFRNGDQLACLRALESLPPVRVSIDTACRGCADAVQILAGRASVIEACREWVNSNSVILPKITVENAVAMVQQRAVSDSNSAARQDELNVLLNRFAVILIGIK